MSQSLELNVDPQSNVAPRTFSFGEKNIDPQSNVDLIWDTLRAGPEEHALESDKP